MKRLRLAVCLGGCFALILPLSARTGEAALSGSGCQNQYNLCIDYYCGTIGHPDCFEICNCRLNRCLGQECW